MNDALISACLTLSIYYFLFEIMPITCLTDYAVVFVHCMIVDTAIFDFCFYPSENIPQLKNSLENVELTINASDPDTINRKIIIFAGALLGVTILFNPFINSFD